MNCDNPAFHNAGLLLFLHNNPQYTEEEEIVRLFVKAAKKSTRETGAIFIGIRKAD